MKLAAPEQGIFAEALARVTPAERAAFLDGACGGDVALRRRIEALLRATKRVGDFLEAPPAALRQGGANGLVTGALIEKPGDRIGRYKLLEQIGEGGCGVVFMAEQEEPVRRRVAFKVIKPGMDTRSVVARFEAERQALALMDHPNIARVFDGGATQAGRPYFVMELVRGVRVTEFCDQSKLSTRARLELFVQVCQAVGHAHQKGIIHRDLKPSNILVTLNDGAAVPKVIDFGIAKSTRERLTDKSLFTQFQAFIGTPAYTSPEQAEMSSVDIDTRSDIYSLGVLLYELLTGQTPFDGEKLLRSGLDEMRRVIREEEPLRPSTRLTTMPSEERTTSAQRRQTDAAKLGHLLRGDLDWIVMKCLEKDRSRRYETVTSLAADVRRHLDLEPVLARPPSPLYRCRQWIRRNKATFVATVAVAVALFAGTAISGWQAVRAHRGEVRANAALADLRATAPAFAAQAQGLAAQGRFSEAIDKLDNAIRLMPDRKDYLLDKGRWLECQLQFTAAVPVFRAVLRLDPSDTIAQTHLALGEKLNSESDPTSVPWQNALHELFVVRMREPHSEVELAAIRQRVVRHTQERLAAIPALVGLSVSNILKDDPRFQLYLSFEGTSLADLSPLEGLPVDGLSLEGCPVRDLSPLSSMPLRSLNLDDTKIVNYDPLRKIRSLTNLALRRCPVVDLSPIRDLAIRWLDLSASGVTDLSPLRERPLTVLRIPGTRVNELSPLAGLPLRELVASGIPATDFSPVAECRQLIALDLSGTALNRLDLFRGLKLNGLHIDNTRVSDLKPLAGMPLTGVFLKGTPVTDLSPLLECRDLELIALPRGAQNVEILRALPKLRRISYTYAGYGRPAQTAAEFWKEPAPVRNPPP